MQIKLSLDVCEGAVESGSQPLLTLESDAQSASANLRLSLADGKAVQRRAKLAVLPRLTTVSSAISAAMALHGLIPSLGFVCRMSRRFKLDPSLAAVS